LISVRAIVVTLLLLLLGGIQTQNASAQQEGTSYPLVQTSIDPTSGTVGDKMLLQIDVTVPNLAGLSVLPLDIQETTWTISPDPAISEGPAPGNLNQRIYSYTLRPFATGRLTIPQVAVTYAAPGQTSNTVLSKPLWIEIDSVIQGDVSKTNLKEVHPPLPMPLPRSVVWTGLVIFFIILAILAFWLWRRYSARLRRMLGGPLRPDELALKQINQLEDEHLIEQKKLKEFYTRLSDTLRLYLQSAYGVHAADLTSTELLRELDDHAADVTPRHEQDFKMAIARLSELLDESDLVKFARYMPEASQCRRAMQAARDVIGLTSYRFKPVDEEPTDRQVASSQPPLPPAASVHGGDR